MKKILATILALVYLSFSTSVIVSLHYCMGKYISWSFSDKEKKVCEYCGMHKKLNPENRGIAKNNCCKDEHKQIKTEKDQKTVASGFQLIKPLPAFTISRYSELHNSSLSSIATAHLNVNGPPISSVPAIFLFDCNFRI